MSIKVQKILRFIPVVNFVTVFLWIRFCMVSAIRPAEYIKYLLKMFLFCIIITIPRIVVSSVLRDPSVDSILTSVSLLLYLWVISFVAVEAQEKMDTRGSN